MNTVIRCAIGGYFERFDDRSDIWLWHAPDWFWMRDHGVWPNGTWRYGHSAPLVATLHMLWRRWWHREEVCWWGYADDVGGYPVLRLDPLRPSRVYRKHGLLTHGAELNSPTIPVLLECCLRGILSWRAAWRHWRMERECDRRR